MSEPSAEVSPLAQHLGFWMRRVSNHVSHTFAQKLKAHGVTVAEWVILREMYGQPGAMAPSRVAELTGLTRGAVSKLITRLLEKELVTRQESNHDRRYQDIELESAGRSLVPRLALLADANDEEFFSALTAPERSTLKRLLETLTEVHQITIMPVE